MKDFIKEFIVFMYSPMWKKIWLRWFPAIFLVVLIFVLATGKTW